MKTMCKAVLTRAILGSAWLREGAQYVWHKLLGPPSKLTPVPIVVAVEPARGVSIATRNTR